MSRYCRAAVRRRSSPVLVSRRFGIAASTSTRMRFNWPWLIVRTVALVDQRTRPTMCRLSLLAELRRDTIDAQMKLLKVFPWQKPGCSLVYHKLLEHLTVSEMLVWNPQLPSSCLAAMNDRGLASEVIDVDGRTVRSARVSCVRVQASHLYCVLCDKHRHEHQSGHTWKAIWFAPVIDALDRSNALHRSLIAEVLRRCCRGRALARFDSRSVRPAEDLQASRRLVRRLQTNDEFVECRVPSTTSDAHAEFRQSPHLDRLYAHRPKSRPVPGDVRLGDVHRRTDDAPARTDERRRTGAMGAFDATSTHEGTGGVCL
jgi:hypothetical protein